MVVSDEQLSSGTCLGTVVLTAIAFLLAGYYIIPAFPAKFSATAASTRSRRFPPSFAERKYETFSQARLPWDIRSQLWPSSRAEGGPVAAAASSAAVLAALSVQLLFLDCLSSLAYLSGF
jgi:hypothetical protein